MKPTAVYPVFPLSHYGSGGQPVRFPGSKAGQTGESRGAFAFSGGFTFRRPGTG
ncbi:MAG: hypothetical protein MJ078_04770 [Clostridia bacterium]|nr:hypothetical protein [Clostridia bacterium]